MASEFLANARDRLRQHADEWQVVLGESFETAGAIISYGLRDAEPVVLKVTKRQGDEWDAGRVAASFSGQGVVRVLEHAGGAMLMDRLNPGNSLVGLVVTGRDDEATAILTRVIGTMYPLDVTPDCPTAGDWGRAFTRYVATGDQQIPGSLVSQAHEVYVDLSESQTNARLLHGDLQHSNVLFDRLRGWLAVDPKGVLGEIEYEIGAALRNPHDYPALFIAPATIEQRLHQFTSELKLDRARVMGWAFAQAVLSTIWEIEDGSRVDSDNPSLMLAQAIRPMLRYDH